MPVCEGFILAGGASSRMGTDKSRLMLEGRTFIERIAGALHFIAPEISLVGARPDNFGAGWPVVADLHSGCGALGGIHAALSACRAPWAAIVSCDLPFVTGELFLRLAEFCDAGTDAVAPLQSDGRPQPLCTLYSPARCLKLVEQLLREGERRPRVLLRQTHTRWVTPLELADLPHAGLFFLNVNTPEDFAGAREHTKERG